MTASASDAPLREAGLRTRSGNAMLRTRMAILDAAAVCVQRVGVRRTTMSEIAATGGVAKATLYNHFRAKDDVVAALVDARVAAVTAQCEALASSRGLVEALVHAAGELASYAPLRRVAADEPALLTPLAAPGEGRGAEQAWRAVAAVLEAAGVRQEPGSVELVLRWLAGQVLWPLSPEIARDMAEMLARALDSAAAGASAVPAQGTSPERAHPAGLGWPGEPARLRTR